MRRFIAYIITCVTMLVALVAGVTPVFVEAKLGREYTAGEEFVYELRKAQVEKEVDETYVPEDETTINEVADEMRARLDVYGVEDYSVIVEGVSSIRVRVSIDDANEALYVRKYLAFNGQHFTLADETGAERIEQEDLFGDNKATIVHEQDVLPYLILPVKDTEKVRAFIDKLNDDGSSDDTSKSIKPFKANDDSDSEELTPNIFLWNNVTDDDNLAYTEAAQDGTFIEYHLMHNEYMNPLHSTRFWYEKSKEEKTEIGIMFGKGDENKRYDTTALEAANKAATHYMNLFNASSYSEEFKVVDLFVTEGSGGVSYNTIPTKASIEPFLSYSYDVNLAMSLTLISTLICSILVSLILFFFYRHMTFGMIATNLGSIFLTFMLFILVMHATFSPAAVIGGVLLAVGNLVVNVYYANKFKEEVYKGRSIKKANTEVTKRTTMISIDVAVVSAFLGLMLYLLGGSALKPMGIVLFFGALISLVMNLAVYRLLNWLVTNTTKLQEKYNYFNIDPNKVPSLTSDTKVVYEGPYQEKNFIKHNKPFMIGAAVLFVASLAGILVFGIKDKSPLNVASSTQDSTTIYVSLRLDHPVINDTTSFKELVLKNVSIGEDKSLLDESNLNVDYETRVTYSSDSKLTTTYNYYVVTFSGARNAEKTAELEENIYNAVVNVEGSDTNDYLYVSSRNVRGTVGAPNQGFVALATGLGIVGAALYFAFRYKPSRAIATLIGGTASATIAYGVLALLHFIPTTAITSLVMPMTALFSILTTIYLFNKEKDIRGEFKEELNAENKKAILIKAISLSATPLFVMGVISAYIGINYFGFGPMALAVMFGGFILGIVVSLLINIMILGPLAHLFEKLFSKIKLPKFVRKPKREKIKLKARKNSSEPEETIFIGIND